MKYKNYVVVNNGGTWLYVTEVNQSNKTWLAQNDKKAKEFGITSAKNLLFGLIYNSVQARIEVYPDFAEVGNGDWRAKE